MACLSCMRPNMVAKLSQELSDAIIIKILVTSEELLLLGLVHRTHEINNY